MTCPLANFEWNTNNGHVPVSVSLRQSSRINVSGTKAAAIAPLHTVAAKALTTPNLKAPPSECGDQEALEKAARRQRRRGRLSPLRSDPGAPRKPRGILKKTSSYNGELGAGAGTSKKVSFPGLVSSRWENQGSLSMNLNTLAASQSREETPSRNFAWGEERSDAPNLSSRSLNNLSLLLKQGTKEDRKFQAPKMPSRTVN